MARLMRETQTALYRTVRKEADPGGPWKGVEVYGPYDTKAVNRDYNWRAMSDSAMWGSDRDNMEKGLLLIEKQELKPVFHLTPDNGLILGLEWVTYERNGVKLHDH
jgi:hypothetical protein